MRTRVAAFGAALLMVVQAGAAAAQTGAQPVNVDLKDGTGQSVGTARVSEAGGTLEIAVQARGLTPGLHGVHIHAIGVCQGPDFMSAGGHFNPTNKQHGARNPLGAHAGDLPNLEVKADGTAQQTFRTSVATLAAGPNSLFDADGTALVIHAAQDDEQTDPTGNSGGRVACGIVAASTAPAAAAAPAAAPAPTAAPVAAAPVAAAPAPAAPSQLPRTGAAGGLLPAVAAVGALLTGLGLWTRRRR